MVTFLKMVVASVALLATACSANPARSAAAVPLEIPEPPARVAISPVPGPEPPAEAVPVPAARPTAAIPAPARAPAAAVAPAPPPPAPVAQVPEPLPAAVPPPELRPAGPAGRTPTGAQVREALGRAKQKLDQIDRRTLNAGKRADFDSARRFLAQAEGAVKANNLMLAQSSAEKAETLADGLR